MFDLIVQGSQPVLIVGMHRSGTSMLASLLQRCGVYIGDRLLGAGPGNPFGHFEDEGVVGFHRRFLGRRAEARPLSFDDGTLRSEPVQIDPMTEEDREASELVASLRRDGLWGWKDPRTCLMLSYWLKKLPDAIVVAVFRHPLEVYESHLRRANNLDLSWNPGLIWTSYQVYNQNILDAIGSRPDKSIVVSARQVAESPEKVVELLRERSGRDIPWGREEESVVRRGSLSSGWVTVERHEMARILFPKAIRVFEQMEAMTDRSDTESNPRPFGGEVEVEQLEILKTLAKMQPAEDVGNLLPLFESWALNISPKELTTCRETVLRGIQREISERERIIGEMRTHQQDLEEKLTTIWTERDEFSRNVQTLWKQRQEQIAYTTELEEKLTTIWTERDRLSREVQSLGGQLNERIALIADLEGRIAETELRLAAAREEEAAGRARIAELEQLLQDKSVVEGQWYYKVGTKLRLLRVPDYS